MQLLSEIHRAEKVYGLPGFVKAAAFADADVLSQLPADAFADPVRRRYPLHTKAACYLSHTSYWERALDARPEDNDPAIAHRLIQAAEAYGITPDVTEVMRKASADRNRSVADLPDDSFALVYTDGAERTALYPLDSAANVKVASVAFHADRGLYPLTVRREGARKILKSAAEMGSEVENRDWLEKLASSDYGDVDGNSLAESVGYRVLMLKRSQYAPEIAGMAKVAAAFRGKRVSYEVFEKTAEALDEIDRRTGLYLRYHQAFEKLPLPEDVVRQAPRTEKRASETVRLTNGARLDLSDLGRAGLAPFRVLPDYLSEVSSGGALDLSKCAAILPTLPRDEADLFEHAFRAATAEVQRDTITRVANWFYVAGSLCFLIGTVLNMLKR